ncbi:MAG: hypothetical protein H0Z40_10435 [Desulfotomaculum sp.]|nr:hypothetical protein [Desulfotomaculum sp.]
MQMNRNERSILAYFPSILEAQSAAEALKELGINEIQVDRVSRYGIENNSEINRAVTGEPSQAGLTLFSSDHSDKLGSRDERVLAAADPSVSGIGDSDYGAAGGASFLVTAVTDEKHLDQAIKIVQEKGGQV